MPVRYRACILVMETLWLLKPPQICMRATASRVHNIHVDVKIQAIANADSVLQSHSPLKPQPLNYSISLGVERMTSRWLLYGTYLPELALSRSLTAPGPKLAVARLSCPRSGLAVCDVSYAMQMNSAAA